MIGNYGVPPLTKEDGIAKHLDSYPMLEADSKDLRCGSYDPHFNAYNFCKEIQKSEHN